MSRWDDVLRLRKHLIEVLNRACEIKPRDFEREVQDVCSAAIEWARTHEGCVIPEYDKVLKADTYAAGHVDWGSKFPLYVAELTYGYNPWGR